MNLGAAEKAFIEEFTNDLARNNLTRAEVFELFLVNMARLRPHTAPQREMFQVFMKCLNKYGPETMSGLAVCAGSVLSAMPPKAKDRAKELINKQIDQYTTMFELLLSAAGMESHLDEDDFVGF